MLQIKGWSEYEAIGQDEKQLNNLEDQATPSTHNVIIEVLVDGAIIEGLDFTIQSKKKIIKDLNPNLIKRNMVNKRFIIMDAKYLKKITQNAVIKTINQIN